MQHYKKIKPIKKQKKTTNQNKKRDNKQNQKQ